MTALRRKQPSAAKSRFHYTAVMYGLKLAAARQAVPFREASFSTGCKAVKRAGFYGTAAEPLPFVERRFFPQHVLRLRPGRALRRECAVARAQANSLSNLYGPTKQAAGK
jgi:hypothetical protein